MASEFDPLRAAREELAGLADVLKTIRHREHSAESAIAEAENELNAVRKLRGFCQLMMQEMQQRIRELEAKADV